ncbi:hypothetical protein ADL28_04415 [Streptomyces violaceusniger]|uniref:Uncharacterized protein n=1 Tax=Streptomyces violaceusniger TaxID=68280 RepID=A0A0X3XAT0_STRVO|nr:hypothetical protein ADL28_04415 [Streptomyces violaceusniger]
MYESGGTLDIQRADELVNAIRALYPALLDDLYFLDDVSQMTDMARELEDTPAHEIVGATCQGFAPLDYLDPPDAE